jgi:two-component system sensor histidine kinase BaeS
VALRVEADEGLPSIAVDTDRMAQVLNNLVSNALRYTPQGGEIVLRAYVDRSLKTADRRPQLEDRSLKTAASRPQTADRSTLNISESGGVRSAVASAASTAADGARAWVVLEVRDTGSGIAAEDLPNVFDRFYRADAARQRTNSGGGGSGLGLAIAKAIIEAHGGTIAVTSAAGEGTTFTIKLPIPQGDSTLRAVALG